MRKSLATCDAAGVGERCDCGANWETDITLLEWKNTTYNKLAWSTTKSMVNVNPTTPVMAQAFFNCK